MTDPDQTVPLAIVVLAAGQGTRMRSARPKVLHELGGLPMIGHVLRTARTLAPERILAVVRHERDAVAGAIADMDPDVVIVDQDDIPGTGRAAEVAVEHLGDFDGDVLVLSGDVPLLDAETLRSLVSAHRTHAAAATVLSAVLGDASGYGRVIRDNGGLITRIVEEKDASAEEGQINEINAGIYLFRCATLREQLPRVGRENAQQEKYLPDVVGLLTAQAQPVAVQQATDTVAALGINDRLQLAEAARLLNERIVRYWQREGVTVIDPATTWIDVDVTLAEDVTVLPGTQILRATKVSSGATIGPDTSLVGCEVGEGATVRRSDATFAVIGAGATVGPFSFLRAGTELSAAAKVGAFVETKNASIGEASKVPHLSYVGDTTVGAGVNLGAGTITANYDDLTKHRTEIGDQVHTGSHNVLVAPVRIGDGAKTGAGAVIRKDVPAGALALSVAPQRNIEGWVEKNRAGTDAAQVAHRARIAQKADDGSQEEDGNPRS